MQDSYYPDISFKFTIENHMRNVWKTEEAFLNFISTLSDIRIVTNCHKMVLQTCSHTIEHLYQDFSDGPSCRKNLYENLKRYDISNIHIPVAFNIFMNVTVTKNGAISVEPPLAKPGDYIILQAHMDCIVALTACSATSSNNGSFKPIQFQIMSNLK